MKGVRLHMAAYINWDEKSPKLEFYHDEFDAVFISQYPRKPVKRMHEIKEEFHQRVLEWEANKPHEIHAKPQGNAMTQQYYSKRLLPIYVNAIQQRRLRESTAPEEILLMEDGDSSHGLRRSGVAQRFKDENWILNLPHPPQSPDLNPSEAGWNIIKQRALKRVFRTLDELKEILQEEWANVSIEDCRKRISEMPERCKTLVRTGGARIKSNVW